MAFVPHSFKHLQEYLNIDHSHTVVIDRMSPFLGFYKNCQDVDAGIPRGPIANWDNVKQVDFKVYEEPSNLQLTLLNNFLQNPQPFKVLHIALYHDASLQWIKDIVWSASTEVIVLDVHDYHTEKTLQQKLAEHSIDHSRFDYADYHLNDLEYQCLKLL